ncbi:MAG: cation:proton antiporter [Chloroflexi bacterium]|nr:cation:proton antiporter [Chloroflexota bacterium]
MLDLVLAVIAAFAGGVVAQRLHLPIIVGYVAAGVVIGPFTPGPTANAQSVNTLAEIGVAFLMFALGAEFSFGELRSLGRVSALGGFLQIGASTALGLLMIPLLGLSFSQGIFLGAVLALSSTIVVTRTLAARGELQTLHGRVAIGMLIAQDLCVVPLAIILPALTGSTISPLYDLMLTAVKALAVFLGSYVIGVRAVPWLLGHVAVPRTRELFILGVVGLALGTAVVTALAGLSLALGAFLAGLVVAESQFRTRVIAEVIPFRDLFVALFFVSMGMLIDPPVLLSQAGSLIPIVALVVVGKAVIAAGSVLVNGLPARTAVLAGLSLVPVGEFSFVLAELGARSGSFPSELFELVLGTALLTIILAPFLGRAGPLLLRLLSRLPIEGLADRVEADLPDESPRRHAIICGYGRVGRELADALGRRNLPYVVIEHNPFIVSELRERGVPVIYGDASNPAVLDHAGLAYARILAILVPDADAVELAARHARQVKNHRLAIIARAVDVAHIRRLHAAGVSAVVQPEFEAGLEVIRHVLHSFGITEPELGHIIAGRRVAFYRQVAGGEGT